MKHAQSPMRQAVCESTQSFRDIVSRCESTVTYLQGQIAVQNELLKSRDDPERYKYNLEKSRLEKDLRDRLKDLRDARDIDATLQAFARQGKYGQVLKTLQVHPMSADGEGSEDMFLKGPDPHDPEQCLCS